MRFARRFLIFSYGLFTIAAQTLLFREFVTSFESNDISVGIFFGSWFLWVGLGAVVVRNAEGFARRLLEHIELVLLAYIPAFVLQFILIVQVRQIAGVESYALLTVREVLLLSLLVNAPVSIITGMLFPVACRWFKEGAPKHSTTLGVVETQSSSEHKGVAVWRVYILEAAGSFVGGLGVTVLLAYGQSSVRISFILSFIISLSVFFVRFFDRQRRTEDRGSPLKTYGDRQTTGGEHKVRCYPLAICAFSFLLSLCFLICIAAGVDKRLARGVRIAKWSRLLPADCYAGSFQTAQAEYLYGMYQGQWVAVREGSVCEALPDESTAGRIAAISLCQNPEAGRVLVVGSGLGLCRQLLVLPQIETVHWSHSDNEYIRKVGKFIPEELQIEDERFESFNGDVRSLLSEKKHYFDIVILDLPDATSSVLNRYYTLKFYHQVKESLRPGGVLSVRVTGGENIMGTELVNLGGSVKLTLGKVFSQLALVPGEESWFIASDSEKLTGEPGILRDRFAKIEGASGIFPPEGLLSIYLPDRADKALEDYSRADLPERLLINRDSRPLTHLYSLLLAAKQSDAPVAKFVKYLALAGPLAFIIPVVVFAALRFVFILRTRGEGKRSSFDSSFLVFSAGWLGIGVVIVLMYLYQTRFGSLYLHIGVISSLFMVGLTVGAILISQLVLRFKTREALLFGVIVVHSLILAGIAVLPAEQWTHLVFAIVFVLCGVCSGCYFPIAAEQLGRTGFEAGQAGSKLETADHLGAALGGMITGLMLVPVLGAGVTLFVFILFLSANVPVAAVRIFKPEKITVLDSIAFRLRRCGYVLFGIAATVILCSNLFVAAGAQIRDTLPRYAAQGLAGQLQLEQASAVLNNIGREVNYYKVYETREIDKVAISRVETEKKLNGYIFSSKDMAPEVRGFGGKMNLAVYVDTAGKLINFHIIRSNETPGYLELLSGWRGLLSGRGLFGAQPFDGVHTVTGATVSSKAVLSALESSGRRFATQVLGISPGTEPKTTAGWASYLPDVAGMYLIAAFVITLIVVYRGGFWSRLSVLIFNLVAGGLILNAQYSTEQIAGLLSLRTPALGLSGAFLLVAGLPVLILFFGNIYCGYICPFGALQELLGYVVPARFKRPGSLEQMREARFIKYTVLFILVIVFFVSRNRTTLGGDPLISAFNIQFSIYDFHIAMVGWQLSLVVIVVIALTGSLFYTRFWCRYLCPVGAFLSLFNNFVFLRRFLPAKKFGRCEFGLTAKDQMDCIYCDKCRYEQKAVERRKLLTLPGYDGAMRPFPSRYFVTIVIVFAIFISTVSISRFLRVVSAELRPPVVSAAAGGQPRDVDMQRIRTMIEQGRLSDKEAEYYEKVD